MKYYITEEQIKKLTASKQTFRSTSLIIESLVNSRHSPEKLGFEMGKICGNLMFYYQEMQDLMLEVGEQKVDE